MMQRTSWRTTLCGIAIGVLTYWSSIGWRIPATRQEFVAFLGSVALLLLGLVARDAKVSQQEHQEEKMNALTQEQSKIIRPTDLA